MTNGPGLDPHLPEDPTGFTRRTTLKVAGAGLLVATAGSVLAACGSDSSSSTGSAASTTAAAGTPKRGGSLNLGASGGGDGDTLEAQNLLTNTDYARGYALYEGLTTIDNTGKVVNLLADSMEPNKDATQWTITLKKGITTHDGKPFGAKDVLYSFKRIVANKFPGMIALGPVDLAASKVVDELTLLLKYKQPYGILPEQATLIYMFLVPEGYNPKKPIGTGPFKVQSFTPGQASTFVRHEGYWDTGKPYLDTLIITNIADETAQVSALQAGQVDAIDYLSSTSLAAVTAAGAKTNIAKTGGWGPITMRVDEKPFSDNRVRQALRLVVDRPQMNEQVFNGKGTVANDVWGYYDPDFNHDLPQRTQDIDKAKSLLKAAGYPSLDIELITLPSPPGAPQAAQVFATQAKPAGVNVKITEQTPTDYFAKSYLKVPFSQDYWPYQPYLVTASQATVKGAPYSATHQNDPAYNALFAKASQTTDAAVKKQAIHDMLQYDYDNGGNIIPYYFPVIDGLSSKVKGVLPSVTGVAMGTFNWKVVWLDS